VARDVTERRQLEAQLRQAQKMEAIGQVAGGVSHDFNNILAVIMMQVQLAEMPERSSEDVRSDLQQIRAAAERGATLTRQLLLFSRRQAMEPKDLDLNQIVASLAKMLRRFIGEAIQLDLRLHGAPLLVHADPGMLDQVVLNLAVNARDAMPLGGRLLIETGEKVVGKALASRHAEIIPGLYVYLTVSDSGTGVAPEVMPRIFEPFFTTKEPDKGTGLGLATVFGIVKQHKGWIDVQSPPGHGATFHVFLPASAARGITKTVAADEPADWRGSETILLVEDEAAVRLVTRALLERFGYRVLEAANGAGAVQIWEDNRDNIALLLTDMVMPGGFSGAQLAERFKRQTPALPVIFATGYSTEISGMPSTWRSSGNFLQKPFRPNQLLQMIRRLLDAGTGKKGSR
jgi:two-component system, cell cycle sensor histidine kinase and response regulator CckA